jgi:gamma-glutamylputrescine oxidase
LPSRFGVGWDDCGDVAAWPGLPRLVQNETADACVVGLGASGLAAARALSDRGLSVVGVDAGRVAAGASGRNGGFLLGGPAAFLHRAITAWGDDAAVELYRQTLGELDRVLDEMPGIARRVGSIRLAGLPGAVRDEDEERERCAELADCGAHAAALRKHGFRVEPYAGELGQGLYLPDDAVTNPAARALRSAQALHGRARLYEQTPVSAVRPGQVRTERGTVHAGLVLVAVDGRLEALLPELAGLVRTARLQMLATAPVPPRLDCAVYCRWGYDYAQQVDGRLFVGGGRDRFADEEWTWRTEPSEPVQGWIEHVAARFAGTPVSVTQRWAASVAFTADGRPLIAQIAPGVLACGGYSGTGNLVGPLVTRAAVELALDGTPPPAWVRFWTSAGHPER